MRVPAPIANDFPVARREPPQPSVAQPINARVGASEKGGEGGLPTQMLLISIAPPRGTPPTPLFSGCSPSCSLLAPPPDKTLGGNPQREAGSRRPGGSVQVLPAPTGRRRAQPGPHSPTEVCLGAPEATSGGEPWRVCLLETLRWIVLCVQYSVRGFRGCHQAGRDVPCGPQPERVSGRARGSAAVLYRGGGSLVYSWANTPPTPPPRLRGVGAFRSVVQGARLERLPCLRLLPLHDSQLFSRRKGAWKQSVPVPCCFS